MQTSTKIIIISIIVAVLAGTWAYKNTTKTAELPEPSAVTTEGTSITASPAALPKPVTTEDTLINISPEKEITTKTRTTVTMTYGETKEDIIKSTIIIQEITTLDKKTGKKTLNTITRIKKERQR